MHKQITQWLVVTDLDGTLLNHYNYDTDNALAAIKQLQIMNIPIIFNTSKTYDESVALQNKLGIEDPFIVENGSCIYLPKSKYQVYESEYNLQSRDQYWEIILGKSHSDISSLLNKIDTPASYYQLLSECNAEEASELTGLNIEQSRQAISRDFSEPLIWKASDEDLELFKTQLKEYHLNTLQGGRFLHVLGNCDKGIATNYFKDIFLKQKTTATKKIKTITLGDSANDAAMLNVGDISIIVKSPSNYSLQQTITPSIQTTLEAPDGWAQGIDTALTKLKEL